ncbi:hypothetical protein LTR56_013460 [Elasticomyces elasticus]|nr:hypothetical protein LTR56_013460 [Elasticomyces elasticus]KAK3652280.1 hypothetical protein LTR22_011782 [Elasticomyces elasticus]KAK4910123.1 hypothetical protein LTR49_021169 [Elasticomyces elasticus]KAK5753920.1 hypothetical protein LTS12_016012 [Elasticomyces elasticus]
MGDSPLLRIPPELRNRIYEDVFANLPSTTRQQIATPPHQGSATQYPPSAIALRQWRSSLDNTCVNIEHAHHIIADTSVSRRISVIQVCRKMRNENRVMFFASHVFSLELPSPGIWSTLAERWSDLAAGWLRALGAEAVAAMKGFTIWFTKEKGVGRNDCILKAEIVNGRANMEKIDRFVPCRGVFVFTGANVVAFEAEVVRPKMVSCFNRVLEVYEDSGALIESPGFDAYRTKEQMRVKSMSAITGPNVVVEERLIDQKPSEHGYH